MGSSVPSICCRVRVHLADEQCPVPNLSLSFIIRVIGKDYEWSNCFPPRTHTKNIQLQSQILLLNLHYIILSQLISSLRSNIIQVKATKKKILKPPQGSFSELVSNRATDR